MSPQDARLIFPTLAAPLCGCVARRARSARSGSSLTPVKNLIMPDGLEMGDTEFAVRKLTCGGLAGAISLIFTHPFDVLRRKMQVAGLGGEQAPGAIATLKEMVAEGFWKGM